MKSIEDAAKDFSLCALMDYEDEEQLNGEVDIEEFSSECFKIGVEFAKRWIPVEEELPEFDEFVLVKDENNCFFVVRRSIHGWINNEVGSYDNNRNISHWRPIELK